MRDAQRVLTRAAVRAVDRAAIEIFGIPSIVLMENAARNAAEIIAREATGSARRTGPTGIVCGRGNNGGDGFAIARLLSIRGISVELFLACEPAGLSGDALTNYEIARRMGLPMHGFHSSRDIAEHGGRLRCMGIIVDAVLGTGFQGEVRPPLDQVILAMNAAGVFTVAIDVPSGLDCDMGQASSSTVRADLTVTFAASKPGFSQPAAAPYVGRVEVADIGAPVDLILDAASGGRSDHV